jgi:hypothetical protein
LLLGTFTVYKSSFRPIPISGFCSIHVGSTTDCNRVVINTINDICLKVVCNR